MKDLMVVDLQPCDEYCRELFATCLDFLKTNEHRQHGAVVLSDGRLLASAETWQEQFFFLQNLTGQAQRLGIKCRGHDFGNEGAVAACLLLQQTMNAISDANLVATTLQMNVASLFLHRIEQHVAESLLCQAGISRRISTQAASFAELGFAPEAMLQLQAFSHLADGLVIFSGPTGHGKTTSLAAFNRLFPSSRKVISLEDPIEIIQDNIEQKFIAETLEPGSFARMVKVVLREDPDILAISEIRDAETAAAAVSASLTGHFVVSTIHASSPRAVLARLQDLKVDTDNLIANGILRGVIGQRLVPQLCPHCSLASEESLEFGRELQCDFGRELVSESVAKLRKLNPEGCAMCHFSGTAGRLLFAEIVSYVQVVGQTSGPTLAEQAAIAVLAGLVDLQHACEIVPDFHTYWQQNTHAASSV